MAGQITDSLIEAMKIMSNDDKETAYECTIIRSIDRMTGEYELDYMSNKIRAYSMDSSKTYAPGDLVFVIAPQGDFNDVKYILGFANSKKIAAPPGKEDGRPYPIHVMSKDSAYGWLTKSQLSGYDTGGYTGDWAGGDGRLALLHSKELVLNKDDTENILDAVQILRQFATKDLAQLVGDAISHGLSSLIGKALNFDSNNYDTTQVNNNTNEEQNVTINVEAVFPHANDIDEIREAILSLPNYASQFKMRK